MPPAPCSPSSWGWQHQEMPTPSLWAPQNGDISSPSCPFPAVPPSHGPPEMSPTLTPSVSPYSPSPGTRGGPECPSLPTAHLRCHPGAGWEGAAAGAADPERAAQAAGRTGTRGTVALGSSASSSPSLDARAGGLVQLMGSGNDNAAAVPTSGKARHPPSPAFHQVKIFEEDFQRERSDRERMNEEKEELKQQLEKLQKQLVVSNNQVSSAGSCGGKSPSARRSPCPPQSRR